jgi:hypothetical protein
MNTENETTQATIASKSTTSVSNMTLSFSFQIPENRKKPSLLRKSNQLENN